MNTDLYIRNVKNKGRGVFCRRPLRQDELIESCPVLFLPPEDYAVATSSRLADYFFNFSREEGSLALALGFGSLYNHAENSNALYYLDRESFTMHYYAIRDIPAHTEICVNYSGEPGKDYRQWFESRNIPYQPR